MNLSEERVSTALFAHHVQKKAIRGVMDKQPRKSRPSDINRRNINHNKCITRVPQGPDYTFAKDLSKLSLLNYDFLNWVHVCFFVSLAPEEFAIKLEQSRRVWDDDYNHEDSDALRIDLIPEDFVQHITPNYGPVPKRLRQPDPRLPKSGTF